jgi:hypothetical protein
MGVWGYGEVLQYHCERLAHRLLIEWRTGTLTARSCLLVSHARDEGAHLLALTSHGQLILGA